MKKYYQKTIKYFYFDKHGKKKEYEAWDKDSRELILALLERSHKDDIGAIYTYDEEGNVKELDYYND